LRRRSTDKSPLLRTGTLSLDPVTKQVFVGDEFIELTNREYAIPEDLLPKAFLWTDKQNKILSAVLL